jgi:polysaccharide biosynthesis/export protein
MKNVLKTTVSLITILLMLSSCVTRKKLTYIKYSDRSDKTEAAGLEVRSPVTPSAYKLMPYDNLYIRVNTPDPQWSALFNAEVGSGGVTQESVALTGYPLDDQGYIEIPFVGRLQVGGKTLSTVKIELDSVFRNYVTDASITVRLVNNYVSILGEVRSPGRYLIGKERLNIFEALSMAGDLSDFGNRQKIQLIRPSVYGPVVKEFSLSDRSILTSEFYYVMPNDIIYAQPISGRTFQVNSPIYSLFLSTITTALVIWQFIQIRN